MIGRSQQGSQQIVDCLLGILGKGLVISGETMFFVDSTYGLLEMDLETALTDPAFEDRALILDLVFFPDHDTRVAVENCLGGAVYGPENETFIAAQLFQARDSVVLFSPDRSVSFNVPVSEDLLNSMVAKLYICRNPDKAVCTCLDEHLPPPVALSAKAMLRLRGDSTGGRKQLFLCRLIEKSASNPSDFEKLFSLSLELLAEMAPGMSVEPYFLAKKRDMGDTLKSIREFDRKRDQLGMEYLLMQRYPVPHESEEAVMDRLRLLTIVTDDLFQLLPAAHQPNRKNDLGPFNTGQDMARLFRIFS